jgi:polynucleotide 5'-hydroxyl-kinase GRC3/NOL9
MITGSKNAGKTTYAKFLTNRILTQHLAEDIPRQTVFWLELDPGQPEFSPAGQLSLVHITEPIFGPAYTHSYIARPGHFKTIRAHCVGAISPKDVAQRYLDCVADLIATYERKRLDVGATKLIMNCPGWLLGEGRSLVEKLIVNSKPTSIVFLSLEAGWKVAKDYQVLIRANDNRPVFPLRRLNYMSHLRTSTQQRLMQQMAYFHHAGTEQSIYLSTPLTAKEGTYLSWNRKRADFLGIITAGDDLNPDFLAECIAGTVVALCYIEDEAYLASQVRYLKHTKAEDMPYWRNMGRHQWLDVCNTQCIGFAYIQEVDVERKRLKIQTPRTKLNALKRIDGTPGLFLMRGRLDQPTWIHEARSAWREELEIDYEGLPKEYSTRLEQPWMEEVRKDDVLSQTWRPRRDVRRWN